MVRVVDGGTRVVDGGTRVVLGGTRVVHGGTWVVRGWYTGGTRWYALDSYSVTAADYKACELESYYKSHVPTILYSPIPVLLPRPGAGELQFGRRGRLQSYQGCTRPLGSAASAGNVT